MIVNVYTDGACSKGKNIRAGYGIYFPNKEFDNISRPFTHEPLTNQRAELYAIYKAIKIITMKNNKYDINIYTDSHKQDF